MAKGNRFSSLPIAQYCAKSAALNVGADRAAAVSSCYHARCAGEPKWREMYARLDASEQDECDAMQKPTVIRLETGAVLDYADAHKEVPLGLADDMSFLPKGHPDCITEGTADFYWFHNRIVYGADLKRTEWTSEPRSLQIIGYNLALCAMLLDQGEAVDGFVPGIFAATEGLWSWGDYCEVGSPAYMGWRERVRAAALHVDGDFMRGRHCRGCYARSRCPAYLVDPAHASEGIAKYLAGELDASRTLELLDFVERAEEMAKTARKLIKAQVDLTGPLTDGEGKQYGAVRCQGKLGFNRKALEEDYPEIVQKYYTPGSPYDQYRWTNDPAFDEQRKQAAKDKAKEKRLAAKEQTT